MKVIKFGGSSLASAQQLNKVLAIVKEDTARRIVVVSAPGKAHEDEIKVTDLLIEYANRYLQNQDVEEIQKQIIERYETMCTQLNIDPLVIKEIKTSILNLVQTNKQNEERLMDRFKASGEDNNAKLIAGYFNQNGLHATYVNPLDAGLIVTDEPGNAQILESSFEKIAKLKDREEILVIPGFFGYTENGEICTFSRGGSDVTGSIVAAGVNAELYENFTDVDAIFAAHPGIINNPHDIKELTYREMRELSYSGFTVLHDEALIPAFKAGIEVVIKNTNNPSAPGTKILSTREVGKEGVIGIAGDSGFSIIYISKYLMNREFAFGRRVLTILEEENIQYEHMPSGIDDISIVIRENQLTPEIEERLISRLQRDLNLDEIKVTHDISMIAIVGEGMKSNIGITARGTTALAEQGINLEMINQGSSEVSILFGINHCDEKKAIRALYNAYFR